MAEQRLPHDWEGRQIEASIVAATTNKRGLPIGLTAAVCVGTLERATDLGIVASLRYAYEYGQEYGLKEDEEPISVFYPWSSVVWIRLAGEG